MTQLISEEIVMIERDTLTCPHCAGGYLHQRQVNVYERREDARLTVRTQVTRSGANVMTVPSAGSGNPSDRRQGVSIVFWCENCHRQPELTFEQHKGNTLVEWGVMLSRKPTILSRWTHDRHERTRTRLREARSSGVSMLDGAANR
jgi:hypothetical protein